MSNETFSSKSVPKTGIKPVYLIVAKNPNSDKNHLYFKGEVMRNTGLVEIRGFVITKIQAEKLVKNPNAEIADLEPINIEIPWQKIYSITNITYKKRME